MSYNQYTDVLESVACLPEWLCVFFFVTPEPPNGFTPVLMLRSFSLTHRIFTVLFEVWRTRRTLTCVDNIAENFWTHISVQRISAMRLTVFPDKRHWSLCCVISWVWKRRSDFPTASPLHPHPPDNFTLVLRASNFAFANLKSRSNERAMAETGLSYVYIS